LGEKLDYFLGIFIRSERIANAVVVEHFWEIRRCAFCGVNIAILDDPAVHDLGNRPPAAPMIEPAPSEYPGTPMLPAWYPRCSSQSTAPKTSRRSAMPKVERASSLRFIPIELIEISEALRDR
jgi:hypothetical protein